ncbi:ROK family protein [Curtobacterium sp. RRHDQ10]|uniref:ROK family transcriptional regulator n=1 Tax=Curtobacterium phyllosphaerae TaxID=3413379 RepID=UPI003BF136C8
MSKPSPGQPALLRELNDRAALTLLLEAGPLTRNELATRTGLSKPTAAEIIRRLEGVELIRPAGTKPAPRGPSALAYEAIVDTSLAVAIDVQLVDVRACVVDARGGHHPVDEYRLSDAEMQGDSIVLIRAAIDRATALAGVRADDVIAVCIGLQASVDHAADTLSFTDTLLGWPRQQVAGTLSAALGLQVILENDANLAAIAERNAGAGRCTSSFALMWMAEGLGMALDIDGRVHSGATGAAGEVGYLGAPIEALALDPDAEIVADLILESAVADLAHAHGITGPDGTALDWRGVLAVLGGLDPKHPFFAALGQRVAYNALPALAVADPEVLILHGPTGVAGGPALAAAATAWLRTKTRWATPFVAPGVTATPVLFGARHVLIDAVRAALARRLSGVDGSGASAAPGDTTSRPASLERAPQ